MCCSKVLLHACLCDLCGAYWWTQVRYDQDGHPVQQKCYVCGHGEVQTSDPTWIHDPKEIINEP